MSLPVRDLTGARFGRWTVLSRGPNSGTNSRWYCRCDCGTESLVLRPTLVSHQSRSCGCYANEVRSRVARRRTPIPHAPLDPDDIGFD